MAITSLQGRSKNYRAALTLVWLGRIGAGDRQVSLFHSPAQSASFLKLARLHLVFLFMRS